VTGHARYQFESGNVQGPAIAKVLLDEIENPPTSRILMTAWHGLLCRIEMHSALDAPSGNRLRPSNAAHRGFQRFAKQFEAAYMGLEGAERTRRSPGNKNRAWEARFMIPDRGRYGLQSR